MTLKKIVDGVEVDMSQEESAAISAEWAESASKPKIEPKSLQQQIDELKALLGK